MSEETLRALSRTYAVGDIDRETYRLQRRELLEGVAAGRLEVIRFIPPEPESPTVFPYDDDEGDTTQEIIPQFELKKRALHNRTIALLAGAALLVLALLSWAGYHWLTDNNGALAPVSSPAPVAENNLLSSFLAGRLWTAASMTGLQRDWDRLDSDARKRLRQSDSMRELSDEILAQLATENALIQLGDATNALETQGQLLDLAEHLGIAPARVERARAAWRVKQADAAASGGQATTPDTAPTGDEDSPAAETLPPALPGSPVEPAVEAPITAPQSSRITPHPLLENHPPEIGSETVPPAAAGTSDVADSSAPLRTNCAAAVAKTRRPYCIDVLESGTKGPVLVVLPPGRFLMGGSGNNEQPRHEVNIGYPLAMGLFEVSMAELQRFCAATDTRCPPQPWPELNLPAVNVSWHQARAYTDWLSAITGINYRLPSESEWEYAARAGTTTEFPFGDEILPTHAHFSFKTTADKPLAANDRSINRNEFRLFHMLGNVREWMADEWRQDYQGAPNDGRPVPPSEGALRVVRGGSYGDQVAALRSAARTSLAASTGDPYTGFRVVRAISN